MDALAISALLAAGVAAWLKDAIKDYIDDWITYYRSDLFNFDNDKSTPDKAEKFNSGNGEWFPVLIIKYKQPWWPGGGGVNFLSVGENGKNRLHRFTMREWRNELKNLRTVEFDCNGAGYQPER